MQDEGRNKEIVSAQLSQPSELMKNEIQNYISTQKFCQRCVNKRNVFHRSLWCIR
jgi:hypothetical protein